jgi:hypothetical protein
LFGKRVGFDVDVVKLDLSEDGRADEPCWFCGGTVVFATAASEAAAAPSGEDAALLSIERLGDATTTVRGVCHVSCAQRSKNSLAI